MFELRQSFIPHEPAIALSRHEHLSDAQLAALDVLRIFVDQLRRNGEGGGSIPLDLEIVRLAEADRDEELMIASHFVPGPRAL